MARDFGEMSNLLSGTERRRLLLEGRWGLEKEAQRVTVRGDLALTPHPAVFGDKLTNPHITTDFAESQTELITPPFGSVAATYNFLKKLQNEAAAGIGNELFWPLSMPPRLPAESEIPLASFGNSAAGREKEIYRRGLALRYGKKMQMISGLHYNLSFGPELLDLLYRRFGRPEAKSDFINRLYFDVARNFLRYRWLLIYLFGASPAADATYDSVICRELEYIAGCCPDYCDRIANYRQFATSLRVSRFGYANPLQEKSHAFFDNLAAYLQNLQRLLSSQNQAYRELGLYHNGIPMQLNDHVLQKESEFYAPIRFKQSGVPGRTQLEALAQRGVEYLEVRILDLNPYETTGISLRQLHFLQVFFLWCLFEASPPFSETEFDNLNKNHHAVALFGRQPGLELADTERGAVSLNDWSREIFGRLQPIAALLDTADDERYQTAVVAEYVKISDSALLPSARIQREMTANQETFLEFGIRHALLHKRFQAIA